jgi:hypothetical protein
MPMFKKNPSAIDTTDFTELCVKTSDSYKKSGAFKFKRK